MAVKQFSDEKKLVLIIDIYFVSFCKSKPYGTIALISLAGACTLSCPYLFHPQPVLSIVVFHVFMTT